MANSSGKYLLPGLSVPRPHALAPALRALLGAGTLGLAAHASAATISVSTTADEVSANGACSLREAIANANSNTQTYVDCAAGTGNDKIDFAAAAFPSGALTAVTISSVLTLSDISATTIDGADRVAIDGGGVTQIFQTLASSNTAFKALTLRHAGNNAIRNYGTAVVDHCTLTGNKGVQGGAIFSDHALTVTGSTIANNSIQSLSGRGGGILAYGAGTVTVVESTLSGNSAPRGGGVYGFLGSGTITISNSTLSGNSADFGGGIYQRNVSLMLTNVTVAGNSATVSGGDIATFSNGSGNLFLRNTIVADASSGGNCYLTEGFTIHDLGGNIDDGSSCGFTIAASSLPNTGPMLSALADNGGQTATMLPLPGSPAIDAVACDIPPGTDQRGIPRPQGELCDIGAVEFNVSDRVFGDGFETAVVSSMLVAD
jgi:CSLREA domain-containing protein